MTKAARRQPGSCSAQAAQADCRAGLQPGGGEAKGDLMLAGDDLRGEQCAPACAGGYRLTVHQHLPAGLGGNAGEQGGAALGHLNGSAHKAGGKAGAAGGRWDAGKKGKGNSYRCSFPWGSVYLLRIRKAGRKAPEREK